MDKKEKLARVAEYLTDVSERATEATKFNVKLCDNAVELTPVDKLGAFHHLEEVVDICRVYRFSTYVSYFGEVMVRIF